MSYNMYKMLINWTELLLKKLKFYSRISSVQI